MDPRDAVAASLLADQKDSADNASRQLICRTFQCHFAGLRKPHPTSEIAEHEKSLVVPTTASGGSAAAAPSAAVACAVSGAGAGATGSADSKSGYGVLPDDVKDKRPLQTSITEFARRLLSAIRQSPDAFPSYSPKQIVERLRIAHSAVTKDGVPAASITALSDRHHSEAAQADAVQLYRTSVQRALTEHKYPAVAMASAAFRAVLASAQTQALQQLAADCKTNHVSLASSQAAATALTNQLVLIFSAQLRAVTQSHPLFIMLFSAPFSLRSGCYPCGPQMEAAEVAARLEAERKAAEAKAQAERETKAAAEALENAKRKAWSDLQAQGARIVQMITDLRMCLLFLFLLACACLLLPLTSRCCGLNCLCRAEQSMHVW